MQITDIAKIAGVGVGTVSRVINNHPDVSEKTRAKVKKVIKEHNYVPNNSARLLKMNNTKNICVFVRGIYNPFFSEIIDYIRKEISKAGYFMILQQEDYKNEIDEIRSMVAIAKENKLKGMISLGAQLYDIENELFKDIDIPIVFTSANRLNGKNAEKFSTISIENTYSAYMGVEHLISKGHKKIAILLGNENDKGIGNARFEGYLKALSDNDIKLNDEYVIYGEFNYKDAYDSTSKLLKKDKNITAIFAISDIMAVGAAKAITDNNLKIGEDIALLGFDGMEVTKYYSPSISTIEQPKELLAKESINLLLDLINGKSQNKHIVIDTNLIERESSIKEFEHNKDI
ncbi:LacI family DNA-binding transcriptional regulator [Clostridium baratii]|uniref:Alanine racemase n=1 Tax=Clostridium baratii TaxID=1561 RepID=A0A174SWJ3_9CLOT|nr:LacI family DNA-binding transcriptional regulator [Clostridium baratii]MBS6041160.1 LacI family DNA-binding transcriptional regulator [Clostridium baratii]CUP98909.1 alanine racemase [Clostridium baratii]STA98712.1 alanine racemase [Clostridium baratii]